MLNKMAHGREMTRELLDIALKYQDTYKILLRNGLKPLEALNEIHRLWKTETLKEPLGFNRTFASTEFMLKIKKWFYIDKKTGMLFSDKDIRFKVFII